jgi:DNA-binding NarL/FixJ family response regulator
VLALSIEEDEYTILKMLRAGAKGYLMKDTKKDILEKALLEVMQKGQYYTNNVSKILMESIEKNIDTEIKDKELEFIKLACTDMSYKEIAKAMFCSYKTVEGYRDSLYKKLGIKNRIGLMLFAIHHNMFTP